MKTDDPRKTLAWLQRKPSLPELRQTFPALWEEVERELAEAISTRNHASLHELLNPTYAAKHADKGRLDRHDKARIVHSAIKQRMTALAVEQHSLAIATGQVSGKIRFNLFNGLIAQRLLFKRDFERKPVSLFLFRLLWPLVWQKRYLMPLVERKGIYCFYSRELINRLADLIGDRPTLEIAAGDGTLTDFLRARGVHITATDDYSWQDKVRYSAAVARMDARSALRHHAPRVVLCSWPPAKNTFERDVFRTPSVEFYIVIGSRHRFASGNWADYETQTQFDLEQRDDLSRLVLPPELGSTVLLFKRKAKTGDASDQPAQTP